MGMIVIVEDNKTTREGLVRLVKEIDINSEVYATEFAKDAIEYSKLNNVNAFFLDIQLSDYTGLELAKQLRKIDKYIFTPIVFITAVPTRELEAFKQIHCYDYIIKPFTKEMVKQSIYKVVKHCSQEEEKSFISIEKKGYTNKIKLADIIYIEYRNRCVYFVTLKDEVKCTNKTLKDVLDNLECDFIQIHKAYIVNKKYIKEINKKDSSISLYDNDTIIPIGRTYKNTIGVEL
jgi:two-component system LytT family response regulator